MNYNDLKGEIVLLYDKTNCMIKRVLVGDQTMHRIRIFPVIGKDISDVQFGFRKCDVLLFPDDQKLYDNVVNHLKTIENAKGVLNEYLKSHKYEVNR